MGGAVPALVNQIAIMLSIMGIGCMLFRMKIIDRAGAKQMADVVIYLACPAITLRTLMVDFDPGKLFDAGFCMALMTVVTLVSIPLTRLFFEPGEGGRPLWRHIRQQRVHRRTHRAGRFWRGLCVLPVDRHVGA